MAMTKCRECQAEISDKAITCPKCGAPALQSFTVAARTGEGYGTRETRTRSAWARSIPGLIILALMGLVGYLMITAEGGGTLSSGETIMWFAVLIAATVCGFIGYVVANPKQQGQLGFVIAFLLGPIGIIVAALLPHKRKCPACFKGIDPRAKVCPSCRTPLTRARA